MDRNLCPRSIGIPVRNHRNPHPGGSNAASPPAVDVKSLHAKIGELTLENDFLEGALNKAGLLSAKR
jgi:hypothetical protein